MSKKRRKQSGAGRRRSSRSRKERRQPWPAQALCVAVLALLAVLHVASVVVEFRRVAGLHRWLMTYAEGFHRRGLVGTIFQFLAGHRPLEAQIELASRVSEAGTYLWLFGALALFVVAAGRVRDRALGWAALGFAAFAFINPMWTTRAFDNGYLDWLVGIVMVAALAAFVGRKPLLSGALVAAGIVVYWGTIFVWLPLGFLIVCLLLRDATARGEGNVPYIQGIIAAFRRREVAALLLPAAAALLSALLHDNDAAIAELTRIGGQENIIRETFSDEWSAVARQVQALRQGWRTYLGVAAVYVLPPALCAGLWTGVMRGRGYALFRRAWLDAVAAVLATLAPVSFLLVAFDLSRLMAWSYLGFVVVAVFWLTLARPAAAAEPEPVASGARGQRDRDPARAASGGRPAPIWPWTVAPLVLAALFWTTPTIYAWVDMSHLIRCERFCFKEQTPQGRALDLFRRRAIASPISEFSAPGGVLPHATGHNERGADSEPWRRVARAGRDAPGAVMDLNIVIDPAAPGATVLAPAQTKRAIIGRGTHRIAISYRAQGAGSANAETRFFVYDSTLSTLFELLRAPLPAAQTEFAATVTPPPELAGNLFRWTIDYSGAGVLDLHGVSFAAANRQR